MCMEAINNNGLTLQYVKEQTDDIVSLVINNCKKKSDLKEILRCLKVQSDTICLNIVKKQPLAIKDVKNQTEEICLEAVKRNGLTLRFIEKQTPNVCLEAYNNNPNALKHVDKKILGKFMTILYQNSHILDFN